MDRQGDDSDEGLVTRAAKRLIAIAMTDDRQAMVVLNEIWAATRRLRDRARRNKKLIQNPGEEQPTTRHDPEDEP